MRSIWYNVDVLAASSEFPVRDIFLGASCATSQQETLLSAPPPLHPSYSLVPCQKKQGISLIEKRFSSTATAIAYIGEIVLTGKYTSLSEL